MPQLAAYSGDTTLRHVYTALPSHACPRWPSADLAVSACVSVRLDGNLVLGNELESVTEARHRFEDEPPPFYGVQCQTNRSKLLTGSARRVVGGHICFQKNQTIHKRAIRCPFRRLVPAIRRNRGSCYTACGSVFLEVASRSALVLLSPTATRDLRSSSRTDLHYLDLSRLSSFWLRLPLC